MQMRARVNYHVKKDVPQEFELDGRVSGELIAPELAPTTVYVTDLRAKPDSPSFSSDGITFVSHSTNVADFEHGDAWRDKYELELSALMKHTIGAKDVIIFDHTVRVDDPAATRRPAHNVHNDFTHKSAEQRLVELVGNKRADTFRKAGFGFVNVWRPIEHTVKSSPLGFIKPASMQAGDWMDIDVIYPDRVGQVLGVAANRAHEWFYLSDMTPDEAIIFNVHDSSDRPHIAHSALDMPGDADVTLPRKSIESRSLIRYC